jgi:phage protein D
MDTTCVMSVEEVIKDWPGKSDSDIASDIFNKYQLTPDVQTTTVTHQEKQSTILQRESDIQFLKRLARRNGYECGVTGTTGYFGKPNLTGTPLPALAAHFADDTNLNSFDVDWNVLLPAGFEMDEIDFLTKQTLTASATQSSQTLLGSQCPGQLQIPNGAQSKVFLRHLVATGVPEMTAMVNGAADDAQWFIEGRGEVDGNKYDSLLHVRQRVPIKGVGESFSGMYYLTSVKHKYTVDRFVMNFTARRNATGSQASDFGGGGGLPF